MASRTIGNQFINWNSSQYSLSTCLAVKNHYQLLGRSQMIRGEETARKVVFGGLTPFGICLIAIIETVARGSLGLFVLAYQCYTSATEGENANETPRRRWWLNISVAGALISGDTGSASIAEVVHTVKNWSVSRGVPYEQIRLCGGGCYDDFLDTMNLVPASPGPASSNSAVQVAGPTPSAPPKQE